MVTYDIPTTFRSKHLAENYVRNVISSLNRPEVHTNRLIPAFSVTQKFLQIMQEYKSVYHETDDYTF